MTAWTAVRALFRAMPLRVLLNGLSVIGRGYLVPLLPGLALKPFFDALSGHAPAGSSPWTWLALYASLGAVFLTGQLAVGYLEPSVILEGATLLRTNLLSAILRRPGARAVPESPGEAVGRLRDDAAEIGILLAFLADPLGQALSIGIALAVLARVSPLVTLAVVVPMLLGLAVVNAASHRIATYRMAAQRANGAVTGFVAEAFGAVTAVKGAGAEERLAGRFRRLNEARRDASIRDALLARTLSSLSANASLLATGCLLLMVGTSMRTGRFTVGDLALFVSYLQALGVTGTYFGSVVLVVRRARVSLLRLLELLQGEPPAILVRPAPLFLRGDRQEAAPAARQPEDRLESLRVTGLTFRHPESGRGIDGASFELRRGRLTVVTGRVGSGKTTLLRTLLGLLPRQAGRVEWNGHEIRDLAAFMVPPRCGHVPQVPRLVSETLRENVLMGVPPDPAHLAAALRAAALTEDLAALDRGLDTPVGPRGVRLSGGQVQRAAIARMLVRDPEVLVVDDASSALDVETEAHVWERLLEGPDRTCLAVSHRRATLRRADEVLVLAEGRVVACGALDELLRTCAELRAIWREAR
ncbi:MAG TPA: ABC transporter ATP-binding protein [Candidatus Dormibacteraeota bacterium]